MRGKQNKRGKTRKSRKRVPYTAKRGKATRGVINGAIHGGSITDSVENSYGKSLRSDNANYRTIKRVREHQVVAQSTED